MADKTRLTKRQWHMRMHAGRCRRRLHRAARGCLLPATSQRIS